RIVHHSSVQVISEEDARKHDDDKPELSPNQAKFFTKTGTVLHLRPELPIVDDGCASPTGGQYSPKTVNWGETAVQLAIYLPGHAAEARPSGYAVKVPKGAWLEFDVHYSNRLG